jgi:alpha-L-rhamnosidase
LAPLRQGATTIWERWDSMLEDGTVNPGEMTSFNHYAFGAVADWMHGVLGGLRAASPGWRSATITPPVWSPLDHVATSHRSAHGQWAVRWRREGDGRLALRAEIPPGCTAEVGVGAGRTLLGEGVHHLAFDRPSDTRRSGAATVRDVMDDEAAWRRVTAAVRAVRPEWSSRDLAREAFAYLDLPLPALARAVGMSIPTHDEDRVRRSLADIAKNLL